MALPKNRPGVLALLEIFNNRILGQTRPAMGCNCGAIHHGPATAVEVIPGGDEYPGQETDPVLWSVHMSEHPEDLGSRSYSCGLGEFLDREELEQLFNEHFGTHRSETNPYQLVLSGFERIEYGFPSAVRIMDNQRQTRFCFEWGVDQAFSQRLLESIIAAEDKHGRRIPVESREYVDIVSQMQSICPTTYSGGPDPVLPFESRWLLDYKEALQSAALSADCIFVQNCGTIINHKGRFNDSIHVVFAKTK